MINLSFADRLRMFIRASDVSQTQFAYQTDISPSEVYSWLGGRRKPGFGSMVKITQAWPELDVRWLLTGVHST